MTEAASWDWVEAKESLPARKDGCDLCRRRHKLSNYTRCWRVFLTQKPWQPRSPFDFAGEPYMPAAGDLRWLKRMKGVKTQQGVNLAGWTIWNEWRYLKGKVGCVWGWLTEAKSWQTLLHMGAKQVLSQLLFRFGGIFSRKWSWTPIYLVL